MAASDDLSDTNGSRNIYVTGHTGDALVVFDRNVELASDDFGKLTLVQSFKDGVEGVEGLNGARAVALSPDGKKVYVAAEDGDAVAVFAREATGGTLVFVEAAFDGENGVDGIDQAYGIAISTNSLETYIAGFGEDAIALFRRASGSRCTGAGVGNLLDAGVEIAAGGQVVYTVNATIDPGATGYLINEAYVTVPGAIQEPGPDSNGLHPAGVCTDNVPPVPVPPSPPLPPLPTISATTAAGTSTSSSRGPTSRSTRPTATTSRCRGRRSPTPSRCATTARATSSAPPCRTT